MRVTSHPGLRAALMVGAAAILLPATAQAEYPERSIEITVPFKAGGGADTSMRTFNKYAEPLVGQKMVVVNKPGAGGTRGWAEFVHSKADGYALAIETPPYSVIPALAKPKQTGYKLDQFKRICIFAVVPDVLVTRADNDFKTFGDLIKFGKANPGKVKVANTGTLGADYMTTLLIENKAGVKFTQVPFTGGSHALQGTLSGTTDVMVASALFAVAQKGNLRTLAIASEARDSQIPDVPTFKELGLDFVAERYRVLTAPPGTPDTVVNYWKGICEKVVANTEFQEAMKKVGQPPAFRGPEKTAELVGAMQVEMQELVDKYKLAK